MRKLLAACAAGLLLLAGCSTPEDELQDAAEGILNWAVVGTDHPESLVAMYSYRCQQDTAQMDSVVDSALDSRHNFDYSEAAGQDVSGGIEFASFTAEIDGSTATSSWELPGDLNDSTNVPWVNEDGWKLDECSF